MECRTHCRNMNLATLAGGFLLGLCVMLLVGADYGNTNGRYQCCPAGEESLAVFVIDTQTGQTWRMGRTDTYDFGTPLERKSERSVETPVRK